LPRAGLLGLNVLMWLSWGRVWGAGVVMGLGVGVFDVGFCWCGVVVVVLLGCFVGVVVVLACVFG
jgi:apolipoprotein N-acyltransferase